VIDSTPPQRAAHLAVPPPRPARRAAVIPIDPNAIPQEEIVYEYPDEYYDYPENVAGGEQEQVVFRISPAFYEVGIVYFWSALISLLITAGVAYARGPLLLAALASAVVFIFPIIRHIKRNRTVYTLTNVKVEIKTGIFSIATRNIPLRNIQDVSVSETIAERLIGIGDVLIESAAAKSSTITMNNIKDPRKYADLILDQLQHWY
jgi:membrane protein YdbS with pleckstrin-like domain